MQIRIEKKNNFLYDIKLDIKLVKKKINSEYKRVVITSLKRARLIKSYKRRKVQKSGRCATMKQVMTQACHRPIYRCLICVCARQRWKKSVIDAPTTKIDALILSQYRDRDYNKSQDKDFSMRSISTKDFFQDCHCPSVTSCYMSFA